MKLKKNQKGLTLIEVLIAMTLFAIFSLVLATAFAATYRMNLNNHKLNKSMDTHGAQIEAGTPSGTPAGWTFNVTVNGATYDIDMDVYRIGSPGDEARFIFFKKQP